MFPNESTIGTCSICGGPVTVQTIVWSIFPPTPRCRNCGAYAATNNGPVIPMTPAPRVTHDGTTVWRSGPWRTSGGTTYEL